jgi:hypothetical protein
LAHKTQGEEKRHWHTRHRTKKKDIGIQDTGRRKKTLAYKTQDEEKNINTTQKSKKMSYTEDK